MNILIVDDVPQIAELIRATLDRAGVVESAEKVRLVHSVTEARREVLRHRPDLIFLDEVLPGESIVDFLTEGSLKGIGIVLVSATAALSSSLEKGASEGVLARFPKWGWSELDSMAERIRELFAAVPERAAEPKKSS